MMRAIDFEHVNEQALICPQGRSVCGQMSIEFVVMFPVMLAIALLAFNATLFLSECASFDRMFREAVCVFAPSPASDQEQGQICAQIEGELDYFTKKDHLSCSVAASSHSEGLTTYTGTLLFTPSLFGAYPITGAFGVQLTPISHSVDMNVDVYKPGVFL